MTTDSRVSRQGVLARARGSLGAPSLLTIRHKEGKNFLLASGDSCGG